MKEKIGKRVQAARIQAGMTQELLAEKVNTSLAVISRLENGHSMVRMEKLLDIADELNVSITDFLCDFRPEKSKDASLDDELLFHISLMTPSEKEYLLEFIKLYNNHHKK